MLCNISFYNQMAIMLSGNMYRNDAWPEITAAAEHTYDDGKATLAEACDICNQFGFPVIADYLNDCRKQYAKQYLQYCADTAWEWADAPILNIHMECEVGVLSGKIFEILRVLMLPLNFGALIILALYEIGYGVFLFFHKKLLAYMSFGIPGCILAIYITSVISLHSATLQRYMVHAIPLAMMLCAIITQRILKTAGQKNALAADCEIYHKSSI